MEFDVYVLFLKNIWKWTVKRDDPFNLEEANSKFYKDLEEKLNPKFIHFEFDTFNPDLDLGSLTLNTQDSGNSQTQSQSTSQTINKQGDTGTTDDDVMNAEEGEVKAVVVSRNRFLKGMETTDSPKGTVYQNQTRILVNWVIDLFGKLLKVFYHFSPVGIS